MPFVNEYIPEADQPRYVAIENAVIGRVGSEGHSPAQQWTRDRERDMFLTYIKGGGQDIDRQRFSGYIFHWAGRTFYIATWLLNIEGGIATRKPRVITERIDLFSEMDETGRFHKHDIEADKGETLALVREAFTARRGSGLLNTDQSEFISILELGTGV